MRLRLIRLSPEGQDCDYVCVACRHVIRFGEHYVRDSGRNYHRRCLGLGGPVWFTETTDKEADREAQRT